MEIKLKNTPEQVELIKAMGSKNPTVAREAIEAIASFIGPVVRQVLETSGTATQIYRDIEFDEDSDPSIPLDLYFNEGTGYVTVWSQSQAGGLPTSQTEGIKELKFGTYRLDSAVSFNKKYARKSRLDVVSKSIERLVQEVLIKQERNAWAVVLKALAEAYTKTTYGGTLLHVVPGQNIGQFGLADLNNLMVRIKRINESFSGNTAVQPYSNGITDLYVSPETKAKIRAFSYNPINTSATASQSRVGQDQFITENLRDEIYRGGGLQSIYGVNIVEMIEFGLGQKYNTLFNSFLGNNSAGTVQGASSTPGTPQNYNTSSAVGTGNEILIGVDNTRGAFLRPVAKQAESGGTFNVLPDGQFDMYGARVEKIGFYGSLEEGRVCLDARSVVGITI
jgi:hypothetical protein